MANKRQTKKNQAKQVKQDDYTPKVTYLPALNKDAKIDASGIHLIKTMNSPVLGYTYGYSRDNFAQSEYDLSEVGRVEDVENIVRQAFKKKLGLMFKAGYDFVGPNKDTVRYIKERFLQIQKASGIPSTIFLRTVGSDLIRLSNAFILKVRDNKASGGKIRTDADGGRLKPVAGYFIIPAETVEIRKDPKNGKVLEYKQRMPDGRVKEFPAKNVVHIYYDKRPGFNIGKPTLVPVVDDIRALRRIEQNIELLIYQHLFPLFHHRVGTKEQPDRLYQDGTKEVDEVRDQIQYMPAEGSIVTSYRHEITSIGAESRAIRAEGYLEHFKKRVIAGLGVSAVDLGEGDTSNRSTSETMSKTMIDDVKDFQDVLMTFINEYMIKELLLESTFGGDVLSEDNIVKLQFKEIDIDNKIKFENHMISAYAGHAITETELRMAFGKEAIVDADREDTFLERVMLPQAEAKALAGMFDDDGLNGGQRAAKATVQPSNQHGKKTGPEKKKSSYIKKRSTIDSALKSEYKEVLSSIEAQVDLGLFSSDWAVQLIRATGTRVTEILKNRLKSNLRKGVTEHAQISKVGLGFPYMRLEEYADYRINKVIAATIERIRMLDLYSGDLKDQIGGIYESLSFRFDFILRTESRRSYLYGISLAHQYNGIEELNVILSEDACVKCKVHKGSVIVLNGVTIEDMPVFHDNCECFFEIKE